MKPNQKATLEDIRDFEELFKLALNALDEKDAKIGRLEDDRDQLRSRMEGKDIRSLDGTIDTAGAYLLGGQLLNQLLEIEATMSPIRTLARKYGPLEGWNDELSVPVATAMTNAEWTGETAAATEDSSSPFGSRGYYPHRLVKSVPVSRKLMRKLGGGMGQQVLLDLMGSTVAAAEEQGYARGSGVGEPLGVIVDSSVEKITSTSPTDVITAELADFCLSLPGRFYGPSTRIFTTAKFINWAAMHLVDGDGRPIIGADWDGKLWNVPVAYSSGLADPTSGANLASDTPVAVIGDWSWFGIVDSLDAELLLLSEVKAATNQMLLQITRYIDGHVLTGDAFAVLMTKA